MIFMHSQYFLNPLLPLAEGLVGGSGSAVGGAVGVEVYLHGRTQIET